MMTGKEDTPGRNLEVRVVKRAYGIPAPDVFEVLEAPMPKMPSGGIVVRVLLADVNPASRGWLSAEQNYFTVPNGAVMPAMGVGLVIESDAPQYPLGTHIRGEFGWTRYAAASAAAVQRIDLAVAPPSVWLNTLGLNGITAWVGLRLMGGAVQAETMLVSTAAGGVGAVVGQLAAAAGTRVVGLVGSDEKVAIALEQFGYAAAINYKSATDLETAITTMCPNGIDAFFDNTGGWIADAVFPVLNQQARVITCGTAATPAWIPTPNGPRRERMMLVKRITWRGFVVMDHQALYSEAVTELSGLYAAGRLGSREELIDGLDQAPGAIEYLYHGENLGRLLIRP